MRIPGQRPELVMELRTDLPVLYMDAECGTQPCGSCEKCRLKAAGKVTAWVVRFHKKRGHRAVGTEGEQRRYVHTQTTELLAMLGLPGGKDSSCSEWARWMRGKQDTDDLSVSDAEV